MPRSIDVAAKHQARQDDVNRRALVQLAFTVLGGRVERINDAYVVFTNDGATHVCTIDEGAAVCGPSNALVALYRRLVEGVELHR